MHVSENDPRVLHATAHGDVSDRDNICHGRVRAGDAILENCSRYQHRTSKTNARRITPVFPGEARGTPCPSQEGFRSRKRVLCGGARPAVDDAGDGHRRLRRVDAGDARGFAAARRRRRSPAPQLRKQGLRDGQGTARGQLAAHPGEAHQQPEEAQHAAQGDGGRVERGVAAPPHERLHRVRLAAGRVVVAVVDVTQDEAGDDGARQRRDDQCRVAGAPRHHRPHRPRLLVPPPHRPAAAPRRRHAGGHPDGRRVDGRARRALHRPLAAQHPRRHAVAHVLDAHLRGGPRAVHCTPDARHWPSDQAAHLVTLQRPRRPARTAHHPESHTATHRIVGVPALLSFQHVYR